MKEDLTIEAGNRYFTVGADAAYHDQVPFDKKVDSNGALTRLMSKDVVHGVDNDVKYLSVTTGSEGVKE